MAEQSVEQEFKALSDKLKGAVEKVEKAHDQYTIEAKNLGKVSEETKTNADKAIAGMNEVSKKVEDAAARLTDIEQKMARRVGGVSAIEMKSLGESFIENDKVKDFLSTSAKRTMSGPLAVSMERKNITSGSGTIGSTAMPNMSLVVPDRQALLSLPRRQLVVRDLLSPGQTNSNAIYYPVQLTRSLNAAPVAEGNVKPQSDLTFDNKITPVQTIAHIFKASRQIMDDAPALQSYIDSEARYGLELAEDTQFLSGDGTGNNLLGIIPQASTFSAPFAVQGETDIDRIRAAILQATLALYPPTGIVLHPTDWAKCEMTKDAQGRYIIGEPMGQITPMLWGLPVVTSMAMSAGTFLVGAFKRGAQVFDRMAIEVLLSTEDQDNFVRNLITIRAEERLALAVYRPASFIVGALPQ